MFIASATDSLTQHLKTLEEDFFLQSRYSDLFTTAITITELYKK